MAEFSRLIITEKGQQLISKIFSGSTGVKFTKISTSSKAYEEDELSKLEALEEIRQTNPVAGIERTEAAAVKVVTAFSNAELTEGYYLRSMGLFAEDPDEGEILYGITAELSGNCYMPPYNGATLSALDVEMVTAVGNAENISLEVDPAAAVTVKEFNKHVNNSVCSEDGVHCLRYFDDMLQVQNESGDWVEAETGSRKVAQHNADSTAHPSILGNISGVEDRVSALEIIVSGVTSNAFAVTYGSLGGTISDGVWNSTEKRLEF